MVPGRSVQLQEAPGHSRSVSRVDRRGTLPFSMVLAAAHKRGQTGHHAAAMSEPSTAKGTPLLAALLLDPLTL